ncbi:hypothetical protein OG21DRAFT_1498649 [Imleria badia]|nr:hypothetical protein OG21DRAFT_1498649 [Imleria badia]
MSGPKSGKYLIELAERPIDRLFIGVDFGPQPVKPVITEGSNRVWTVRELADGQYTLTLDEAGPVFIQEEEGSLVGTDKPPSFSWTIRGHKGIGYTILKVGITPTKAWTVKELKPKSPVTLNTIILDVPQETQLWRFLPPADD